MNNVRRQVRLLCIRRLLYAVVMLMITGYFFYNIPFMDIFWPAKIKDPAGIIELYNDDITYVELTADTLYYTGYDYVENGKTAGSYYYNLYDGTCIFYLLSPGLTNNKQEVLSHVPIKARLTPGGKLLTELIRLMAADLSWTAQGLSSVSSRVLVNELEYLLFKNISFMAVNFVVFVISLLVMMNMVVYMLCPPLYPACRRLGKYGSVKEQLHRLEWELKEEVFLKKGIFIITSHYFVVTSGIQLCILPLEQLVWVYKHSILHRFRLKRNIRITYTIRAEGRQRLRMVAVAQPKEDVDAVLEYLEGYGEDILVGYTKENEREAKRILNGAGHHMP